MPKQKPKKIKIKLAPLKIRLSAVQPKKGSIPVLEVEGSYATQYNEASAAKKNAEAEMLELKPELTREPLAELYRLNCENPFSPNASIKIVDEKKNSVRVTLPDKYEAPTAEYAEELFTRLVKKDGTKPDVNDYVVRTTVGIFDNACFLTPTGGFDEKNYVAITAALQRVCEELKIANPLTCREVISPKPSFHAQRWHDFKREDQHLISQALGNSPSIYPIASAKTNGEKV